MTEQRKPTENEQVAKDIVTEARTRSKSRREWLDARRGELDFTLNLTEREQRALVTTLAELDLETPTDFVRHTLDEYGRKRHQAKLESITQQAWPNGAPEPDSP